MSPVRSEPETSRACTAGTAYDPKRTEKLSWRAAAESRKAGVHRLTSPVRDRRATMLSRPLPSLPLVCPHCSADMRIVAFITEAAPVARILTHIGEPAQPPGISPVRGPPAWEDPPVEAVPDWDALTLPPPEYAFDQRVQWSPPPAAWSRRRPAISCIRCARAPSSDAASSPGTFPDGGLLPISPRRLALCPCGEPSCGFTVPPTSAASGWNPYPYPLSLGWSPYPSIPSCSEVPRRIQTALYRPRPTFADYGGIFLHGLTAFL